VPSTGWGAVDDASGARGDAVPEEEGQDFLRCPVAQGDFKSEGSANQVRGRGQEPGEAARRPVQEEEA
jgi:hypothetical protein